MNLVLVNGVRVLKGMIAVVVALAGEVVGRILDPVIEIATEPDRCLSNVA